MLETLTSHYEINLLYAVLSVNDEVYGVLHGILFVQIMDHQVT